MSTWQPADLPSSEVEPRRIGEHLEKLARSIGGTRIGTLAAILNHWEQVAGPEIAAHSRPRSLRDGMLVIEVDQPAWAAQLSFLTSQLLAKIDPIAGGGKVREIRFRVASDPRGDPGRSRAPRRSS